jgi:hypothetical protein
MQTNETAELMRRFTRVFLEHRPAILKDLIAPDCVMESIQPAPNGTRYEGYDACLAFWAAIAADPNFALAHLYSAFAANSIASSRTHLEHAVRVASGASPAEQLLIRMEERAFANDQQARLELAQQDGSLRLLDGSVPRSQLRHDR